MIDVVAHLRISVAHAFQDNAVHSHLPLPWAWQAGWFVASCIAKPVAKIRDQEPAHLGKISILVIDNGLATQDAIASANRYFDDHGHLLSGRAKVYTIHQVKRSTTQVKP